MKTFLKAGLGGRVPAPPEKRFLITLKGHRPGRAALSCTLTSLMLLSPCICARAQDEIGVAIISGTGGDAAEKKVYQYLGGAAEIDEIYVARNRSHFFELLKRIRKTGRRIGTLAIAGHGSGESPMIEFEGSSLMPGDFDLKQIVQELDRYRGYRERKLLLKEDASSIDRRIAELETALEDIASVQETMAPNATVQLLNCSTAYSEKGRRFIRNLGNVLLGQRGGTIIASTSDVAAYQIEDRWDLLFHSARKWEWQKRGEFDVWGDWMHFKVAGGATEGWIGSWRIRSTHTRGVYKGASREWPFVVSETAGQFYVLANGIKSAASVAGPVLTFDTRGGGNYVRITLYRIGDSIEGPFSGYRESDKGNVGGVYSGTRTGRKAR